MTTAANPGDTRGHVEYVQVDSLPLQSFVLAGHAMGLRCAALSANSKTGAMTCYADIPELWRYDDAQVAGCDMEILVLRGDLHLGANRLSAGTYATIPRGASIGGLRSDAGALAILMFDATPSFLPAVAAGVRAATPAEIRIVDLTGMPWQAPDDYEGRSRADTVPGLSVKLLREHPETGAYTLLARHAPGWSDLRLESHDTWEELLLLEGDYLMGATGAIRAGAYIFRPGSRPHGPQATRAGAVWFCRGEKRIDFNFHRVDWAAAQVEAYLSRNTGHAYAPWGPWSEANR